MPKTLHPGVYVEELPARPRPIEGVPTSTAGFIGAGQAHLDPVLLRSFVEFERTVGAAATPFLSAAVRGFFQNGGQRCRVAIGDGKNPVSRALTLLASEDCSMLCCPDEQQLPGAAEQIAEYCEHRKDLVGILQPVLPLPAGPLPGANSSYVVRYCPWLVVPAPDVNHTQTVPPGGHVAGALARTDRDRGVQRSPDGLELTDVLRVSQDVTDADAAALVQRGVNVIRHTPNRGTILFGARTASEDAESQHVHVRRLLIYLEQSIQRGLQWAVFEPNDPALWISVSRVIEDFLVSQWQHGVLLGSKPEQAFFVRCDASTMTQEDLENGRFIAVVGVAPLRPAEFVILRFLGQTTKRSPAIPDPSAAREGPSRRT